MNRSFRSILSFVMPLLLGCAALAGELSPGARDLVAKSFQGLDGKAPLVDAHVHIVGTRNGCEVNPRFFDQKHPFKRLAGQIYMKAGGTNDLAVFDETYVKTLAERARVFGHPIRLHILAMDHAYRADGTLDRDHSDFYVPNGYVVSLAQAHPGLFVPVISVHPARADALAELDRWAAKGVRWVKWLPNAQGMDPADPRWDSFYRKMASHGMILLAHTGEEKAVSAAGAQALGNPLRLRRPLDLGVRVVAAHCASAGRNADLDHPGKTARNFDLFLRLMAEDRYRGRLYGDISAMTLFNHLPGAMRELLRRPDIQARLLNGSDYPLPAIRPLTWTTQAVALKLITPAERKALNEINRQDPLLFDFVLKRTLRDPRTGGKLEDALFTRTLE
ncbi:MAG: amidohydrolase 2 [Holophagaceae bacterium]|nr:amidohydrolase 2 [Holophagaceae bacterium]